jgi:hypothetical protein
MPHTPTDVLAVRLPAHEGRAFRSIAEAQGRPYGQLLGDAVRAVLAANGHKATAR